MPLSGESHWDGNYINDCGFCQDITTLPGQNKLCALYVKISLFLLFILVIFSYIY